MFVIREVMHCKPGSVRPLLEKFRGMSAVLEESGRDPLRLLTDVAGPPFWTLIIESEAERLEEFLAVEQELMENEEVRAIMADYHDLVESGRREVYRLES